MATSMERQILEHMMAQEGVQQGQEQGLSKLDPRIDMIAKKMALLKGKPEEKYSIFVQILPQLLEQFGNMAQAPEVQAGDYKVMENLSPAMPREGFR